MKDVKHSKKKGNFKPKQPSEKEPAKGFKERKLAEKVMSANDFMWYSQYPQLALDAGALSFNNIAGLPVTIKALLANPDASAESETKKYNVPGIMAIRYYPSIGVAKDGNSNINVAARQLFTFTRKSNAGSCPYESADEMMYFLHMNSLYAYYAYLKRIYGLFFYGSVRNRYVAKALVEAAGGNYDDLNSQLADFRYYINQLAAKINAFAAPKNSYIFDRSTFLPLHVFTDGDSAKSQMYVFKPNGFYCFNGTKYETGTCLEFIRINDTMTFAELKALGDRLVTDTQLIQDVGIISGDILKAFGDDNIRKIGYVDDKYITPIIKDDGILWQIHNSTAIGVNVIADSLDIRQENMDLKYQIIVNTQSGMEQVLLDAPMENPNPEFVMEATRLMTTLERVVHNGQNLLGVATSGSEVVSHYQVYKFSGDSLSYASYQQTVSMDTSSVNAIANSISELGKFDWHPILYYVSITAGTIVTDLYPICDLQNYTSVGFKELDKLHNCALISLFNIHGIYNATR